MLYTGNKALYNDVQNPIIGSLLQQINKSKLPGYEETKKY